MVAAERDRQRAGRQDLADVGLRARERLLRVGEHDVAVAAVDGVERLDEVEVVGRVVGQELARDLADAARPVVGAGAADVGGVEGDAVDRRAGTGLAQRVGVGAARAGSA